MNRDVVHPSAKMHERSDQELLSDVTKLLGAARELTAKLVAHLAEIEERRLHLLSGFTSMFDFCQQKLGMSEGEAFRRILAARLCRRFPRVRSLLASGTVNLSTLELVRDYLTEENHEELLAAVAHRPKREVMEYLATRFPRPDRPSRIQRLATIEPLSAGRFKVEFTAGDDLRAKLELCRDLMSHANPRRDLAVVIERAVDLLLADLERKRLGKTKRSIRKTNPREVSAPGFTNAHGGRAANAERRHGVRGGGSAHEATHETLDVALVNRVGSPSRITNVTRRKVFERDGLQCAYRSENGRRCEARAFLELDHIDPKALGGPSDSDNLRVLCRAHNQLLAEEAFGREHVERRRHFRQRKYAPAATVTASAEHWMRSDAVEPTTTTLEKVRQALRKLGFRDSEARRAVATVARMHDSHESLALERALREALQVATAA